MMPGMEVSAAEREYCRKAIEEAAQRTVGPPARVADFSGRKSIKGEFRAMWVDDRKLPPPEAPAPAKSWDGPPLKPVDQATIPMVGPLIGMPRGWHDVDEEG